MEGKMNFIKDPSKKIPVLDRTDVLVVSSGPDGKKHNPIARPWRSGMSG
jgi:hypothetical protein